MSRHAFTRREDVPHDSSDIKRRPHTFQFESLGKDVMACIATYLCIDSLKTFCLLSKFCFYECSFASCITANKTIDIQQLSLTHSIGNIREFLSIFKHHIQYLIIPSFKSIDNDTIIVRQILNLLYHASETCDSDSDTVTAINTMQKRNRNRNDSKSCVITGIELRTKCPNFYHSSEWHKIVDIAKCLPLLHLDISESCAILSEFHGCLKTLQYLCVSQQNFVKERNIHINNNNIDNNNINTAYQSHSQSPSFSYPHTRKIELLSQYSNLETFKMRFVSRSFRNNFHERFDHHQRRHNFDLQSHFFLTSTPLPWNLQTLYFNNIAIQIPLAMLLIHCIPKYFPFLRELYLQRCLFGGNDRIMDDGSNNEDSLLVNDDNGNDDSDENFLQQYICQKLSSVSVCALLRKLQFEGTQITAEILDIIGVRFGCSLKEIVFKSCQLPCMQSDWHSMAENCVQLQRIGVHKLAYEIHNNNNNNNNDDVSHSNYMHNEIIYSSKTAAFYNANYEQLRFILNQEFNNNNRNIDIQMDDCFVDNKKNQMSQTLSSLSSSSSSSISEPFQSPSNDDTAPSSNSHNFCDQTEFNKDENTKSARISVSAEFKVSCELCPAKAANMIDLIDHQKYVCSEAMIACSLCGLQHKRKETANHLSQSCVSYKYVCILCCQILPHRQSLLMHYQKHAIHQRDTQRNAMQFHWNHHNTHNDQHRYPTARIWICLKCNHRNMLDIQKYNHNKYNYMLSATANTKKGPQQQKQLHQQQQTSTHIFCENCLIPAFMMTDTTNKCDWVSHNNACPGWLFDVHSNSSHNGNTIATTAKGIAIRKWSETVRCKCAMVVRGCDMRDHLTICKLSEINCQLCAMSILRQEKVYHWRNHCCGYKTICSLCQQVFENTTELQLHYQTKHSSNCKDPQHRSANHVRLKNAFIEFHRNATGIQYNDLPAVYINLSIFSK